MSLLDAYEADNAQALTNLRSMPPAAPRPRDGNAWTAPFRGIAAGALQIGASLSDEMKGFGSVMAATGTESAGGMFSLQDDKERAESIQARARLNAEGPDMDSEAGDALRDATKAFRPDPTTASFAERVLYDVPRFVAKAVAYMTTLTPVGGAVALGADEAITTSADLREQGVDRDTAAKVAALTGFAAGATALLPMSGSTVARSVGLYATGGPGAFIAQQAATREILNDASYAELAQQYDPLDPLGLAVSAIVPLPFLAHGVMGLRSAHSRVPQGEIDAAMVHNLTLQQDMHAAGAPEGAQRTAVIEPAPRQPEMPAALLEPDEAAQQAATQQRLMALAAERRPAARRGRMLPGYCNRLTMPAITTATEAMPPTTSSHVHKYTLDAFQFPPRARNPNNQVMPAITNSEPTK
jgi:hypothetical protein